MKKFILIFILALLAIIAAVVFKVHLMKSAEQQKLEILEEEQKVELEAEQLFHSRLRAKADTAKTYAQEKGLDLSHAFLIDFSLHSGKHRLFIWNFDTDSVEFSSLCAHGIGKDENRSSHTNIIFSNIENSYCSSLGKYKTGTRSYSNWGINVHYKLHGLDKTNSNAFRRLVVLHSHSLIPREEIYPEHIPLGYSLGCPVISDYAMKRIDNLIKKKDKPVLLWIYI